MHVPELASHVPAEDAGAGVEIRHQSVGDSKSVIPITPINAKDEGTARTSWAGPWLGSGGVDVFQADAYAVALRPKSV